MMFIEEERRKKKEERRKKDKIFLFRFLINYYQNEYKNI
jgi:hypothetical protein